MAGERNVNIAYRTHVQTYGWQGWKMCIRDRRMGWFDCVASKYGCRIQGTTDVAFTVLDVLGYLDAVSYTHLDVYKRQT